MAFAIIQTKLSRYCLAALKEGRRAIAFLTAVCCCRHSLVAGRGSIFHSPILSCGLPGRKCRSQLWSRVRYRGLVLAYLTLERRALKRPSRLRGAARGEAFVNRAEWKRRGRIGREARWSAIFLARRGYIASSW